MQLFQVPQFFTFMLHRIFDGIFAGETDWKVLCIDVNDPLAEQLNGR